MSRAGAKLVLNPRAALEPRSGDIALPDELFLKLSFFQQLKQKPSLEKFPGALVLRSYQPGEVICRQGEAGWTAYSILTRQDLELLHSEPRRRLGESAREQQTWEDKRQKAANDKERKEADEALAKLAVERAYLPRLVATLEQAVHLLPVGGMEPAEVAKVILTSAQPAEAATPSLLARMRNWFDGSDRRRPGKSGSIQLEANLILDAKTRTAALHEGQLFGEMSCFYRTPRAATIVATRECYLIEMLRSILDQMQKDPAYRERTAKQYRERTLSLLLRESPLFRGLSESMVDLLRTEAELVDYEPGSLICDEQEPADSLFLIRSGIVKVLKNASSLLERADVPDSGRLAAELHAGSDPQSGPRHVLWQRLPGAVRTKLADASAQPLELITALNEVIRDPSLAATPELRELVRERRLGARVWTQLADSRCQAPADLFRANRAMLACIFAGQIQDVAPGDGDSAGLQAGDIRDPKAFLGALFGGDKKPGDARRLVWELLAPSVQKWIADNKAGGAPLPAELLAGLNMLLGESFLLLRPAFHAMALGEQAASKNIRARMLAYLPRGERWTEYTFQRGARLLNRLALEAICPQGLRPQPPRTGPARVVAYEAQGAVLGEMGLIENEPRSATLVAYNHPDDDPEREVGPVQIVRIGAALFQRLRKESPEFEKLVEATRQSHRAEIRQRAADPLAAAASPLVQSERAEQLGLIQGQRLMLIDLDRCTRCDECVQACVRTHDDGRTRLFLDGPRFGQYLVPMTCRSCLDPVCMIGCPVGSIHRGDNRQIVIEDWCIGCGLCASQCPYDAIQMHDLGILPASAYGWRFELASRVPSASWFAPGYRDRAWPTGKSPFKLDREFHESLGVEGPLPAGTALCFRQAFDIAEHAWKKPGHFALELESPATPVQVWLNGQVVEPAETKRDKRTYVVEDGTRLLDRGQNCLAVRLEPAAGHAELLSVRLDRLEQPRDAWGLAERATQKAVTQQAVVCDLCSHLSGGPACVSSCPHDAAMRVNSRVEFPMR